MKRLGQEISSRENLLNVLRLLIERLKNQQNESKETESIIGEVYNHLINLRILTVNVVIYFMKFWEISAYNVINGKYEIEKINKSYGFDRNYLTKVMILLSH